MRHTIREGGHWKVCHGCQACSESRVTPSFLANVIGFALGSFMFYCVFLPLRASAATTFDTGTSGNVHVNTDMAGTPCLLGFDASCSPNGIRYCGTDHDINSCSPDGNHSFVITQYSDLFSGQACATGNDFATCSGASGAEVYADALACSGGYYNGAPPEVCGNFSIEGAEQCDDGNTDNGDGCSQFCEIEVAAVCGNDVLEGAEQCDDGNTDNGDGCSATCESEEISLISQEDLDRSFNSAFRSLQFAGPPILAAAFVTALALSLMVWLYREILKHFR